MVLAETACRFNGHVDGNEKQRADSCSLFLFSILSLSLSGTRAQADNRKRSNDYNSTRTNGRHVELSEGDKIRSILVQNKKLS